MEEPDSGALFSEQIDDVGATKVELTDARSILTRASGFMKEYDFTLNPYSGCSFGCTYCYAAFFSRDQELQNSWGEWVKVKQNALKILENMRTNLTDKSIYMSSVTDPYQPIERKLKLVRRLLIELAKSQPRLVVQTRSPLVTRDIDILKEFNKVSVNMTITTDSEEVRRVFEPKCPTNALRLEAIKKIQAAGGLDAGITLTPLLPIGDVEKFADQLLETGVQRYVIQPFHPERGRFVASTRNAAVALSKDMGWNANRHQEVVEALRKRLPRLTEGKEGFAP